MAPKKDQFFVINGKPVVQAIKCLIEECETDTWGTIVENADGSFTWTPSSASNGVPATWIDTWASLTRNDEDCTVTFTPSSASGDSVVTFPFPNKQVWEGDVFPVNAKDGDILIQNAGTPCEKRWQKCGDRHIFVSAFKPQAAALGGTFANGTALSLAANTDSDPLPWTSFYDTHLSYTDEFGQSYSGYPLIDGVNICSPQCCSFLITAGVNLNVGDTSAMYELELCRDGVLIAATQGRVVTNILDADSVTVEIVSMQPAFTNKVNYTLKVINESAQPIDVTSWYVDITSLICEPNVAV